jgi:hypothetical protein
MFLTFSQISRETSGVDPKINTEKISIRNFQKFILMQNYIIEFFKLLS